MRRAIHIRHKAHAVAYVLLGLFIVALLLLVARPASALNAYLYPDGDGSLGNWVTVGSSDSSCAGGAYCDFIDDQEFGLGTPGIADSVQGAANNGGSIVQRMTSVTGVGSATAVEVFVYHNDGTNGEILLELTDDAETASYGTFTLPQSGVSRWDSHVFPVALSQSQVDTLAVKLTANRNGGGPPASIRVYALHADITYSATPPASVDLMVRNAAGGYVPSDGPIAIGPGDDVELSWSSSDATSCTASDDWSGSFGPSGTQVITSPASGSIFTMTCAGPGGTSLDDSVTVQIVDFYEFTAHPSAGTNPLTVDLRTTMIGGVAETYLYHIDCDNDGTDEHVVGPIGSGSHDEAAACTYTSVATHTAQVEVYHSHAAIQQTVNITVSADALPVISATPGVTNDGPLNAGEVVTFSIPWTDAEGIGSGYAVVCKEASGGGAPPVPTGWPPVCANGYWSDGPVVVSGTGSTATVPYTTVNPGDIGSHAAYAFICQSAGSCSITQIGTTDTLFKVQTPPSGDDLLSVNLSTLATQYDVGETFTYTLTLTNNGFGGVTPAGNVVVEITLPATVTFDSAPGGGCTPPSGPIAGGVTITCTWSTISNVSPNNTVTQSINVTADNPFINTTASAALTQSSPEDEDPAPGFSGNNSDTAIITIVDPLGIPNAVPTLGSPIVQSSSAVDAGPAPFWDDAITSISDYDGDTNADVDVSVAGEATLFATDPPTARGTIVSRPVDSRAQNGIAPVKMTLFGDLPDTLRDPSYFLRGFMWNPRTGPIGASCENIVAPLVPTNEPYDDNCTDSGHPSGEWRVGVDLVTGNYGGEITSVGPSEPHLLNTPIGWAWSDSVGWIAFSCDTPGAGGCGGAAGTWRVSEDVVQPLSANRQVTGWAWSPVIGWVSFDCTTSGTCGVWDDGRGLDADPGDDSAWIDANGVYHGWAWSPMVGWISLNCSDPWVGGAYAGCGQVLSRAASGGYAQVELEIGTSNCPNGEINPPLCDTGAGSWSWNGPYAFNDVGNVSGLGSVFEADITADIASFWNTRYVRYRMTLCSFPDCGNLGTANTPIIRGVSVLWAP